MAMLSYDFIFLMCIRGFPSNFKMSSRFCIYNFSAYTALNAKNQFIVAFNTLKLSCCIMYKTKLYILEVSLRFNNF